VYTKLIRKIIGSTVAAVQPAEANPRASTSNATLIEANMRGVLDGDEDPKRATGTPRTSTLAGR